VHGEGPDLLGVTALSVEVSAG